MIRALIVPFATVVMMPSCAPKARVLVFEFAVTGAMVPVLLNRIAPLATVSVAPSAIVELVLLAIISELIEVVAMLAWAEARRTLVLAVTVVLN